jgi:hypothetical protein
MIIVLCLDQVKNYVNAVEQNPKLLKLALSAEKEELNGVCKTCNSEYETKPSTNKVYCSARCRYA